MARILILSGGGDLVDPWHPFTETSALLAGILAAADREIQVTTSLARLEDPDADLVVVNAGNAEQPTVGDARAVAGLDAWLRRGGALLALHVSSTAFPDVDAWEAIIGARWVRGTTMHPDQGHAAVRVETDSHPVVAGVRDFTVWDERYTHLRVAPDVLGLAWHEHEGAEHPLLWAREHAGARVVYDALGHDAASYESPEHRAIIANAADWLLG